MKWPELVPDSVCTIPVKIGSVKIIAQNYLQAPAE